MGPLQTSNFSVVFIDSTFICFFPFGHGFFRTFHGCLHSSCTRHMCAHGRHWLRIRECRWSLFKHYVWTFLSEYLSHRLLLFSLLDFTTTNCDSLILWNHICECRIQIIMCIALWILYRFYTALWHAHTHTHILPSFFCPFLSLLFKSRAIKIITIEYT